jgi:hypothetical protein
MIVLVPSSGWNGKIYWKVVSDIRDGASQWVPLALRRAGLVERKGSKI